MIAKYDQNGNQKWFYTIGGPSDEYIYGIQVSNDGLVIYAAACQYSFTFGDRDHSLIAMSTTSTGSYLWYKRYGCSQWDFLHGITLSTDN